MQEFSQREELECHGRNGKLGHRIHVSAEAPKP